MHELGVVIEVIKSVEKFAGENHVTTIDTLVLQIGELCSMIPKYVEAVYPAAVEGTLLENTQLRVEIIPGNGHCNECGKVFNILENNGQCPTCQSKNWELLGGREFLIKEIVCC